MNISTPLSACTVFALILLPLVVGISDALPPSSVVDITPDTDVNTTRFFIANISGSNFEAGVHVLLVPVNAQPVHMGSITDGGIAAPFLNVPQSVFVSGDAYIVSQGSNALEIVDVSNPSRPIHKGGITNGTGGSLLNAPKSVYISGNYAYIASFGNNALEIVDVSNPSHPAHKGSITNGTGGALLNNPKSVYVSGNYAYVASQGTSNALEIVNISDPANPAHTGSMKDDALMKTPTSVFVSGNYAYVTSSGSNTLVVVDVSNPASPVRAGYIKDGGDRAPFLSSPSSVYVAGTYAYVASSKNNALEIVDISNPVNPVHKASIKSGIGDAWLGGPSGVFVVGTYAYVASSESNALEIVDISNPAVPVHLARIINEIDGTLLNFPSGVYVSGNYAYVTSKSGNGLEIVDIGGVTSIPATGVKVPSTSMITCAFNLTNARTGLYNVVVTNPGGSPATLANGFTITAPPPPPAVTGINPSNGCNTTLISVANLTGCNFSITMAPSVRLNRTGYADIAAANVTVISSTQLSCTFDITGQVAGNWNVVATNPDGQEGMLVNGFSVTPVVPTPMPTTVPPTEQTTVPTTEPTMVPLTGQTTVPPIAPPTIPTISSESSSADTSGLSGRGTSSVTASAGAPAGGTMTFAIKEPLIAGGVSYPYAIISVSFMPSQALGSTDLTVTDVDGTSYSPGDGRTTAGIVAIEPVAVNPSEISSGAITFAVLEEWLTEHDFVPSDITLMRSYEGTWSELPTIYEYHYEDAYYFTATTPGFSYFAITTLNSTTSVNATATVTAPETAAVSSALVNGAATTVPGRSLPTTTASDASAPVIPGTTIMPAVASGTSRSTVIPVLSVFAGIGGIVIVVVGGILIRLWWIRRQNPALFRKYD